jgi:hypothetical protein
VATLIEGSIMFPNPTRMFLSIVRPRFVYRQAELYLSSDRALFTVRSGFLYRQAELCLSSRRALFIAMAGPSLSPWPGFLYRHGQALFIAMAGPSLSSWPGLLYRHGRA